MATLYNAAPDDVRLVMEATSTAIGPVPFKSANGLEWKTMLSPESVREAVVARAQAKNSAAAAKLRVLEEIREMTNRAATIAIAEI